MLKFLENKWAFRTASAIAFSAFVIWAARRLPGLEMNDWPDVGLVVTFIVLGLAGAVGAWRYYKASAYLRDKRYRPTILLIAGGLVLTAGFWGYMYWVVRHYESPRLVAVQDKLAAHQRLLVLKAEQALVEAQRREFASHIPNLKKHLKELRRWYSQIESNQRRVSVPAIVSSDVVANAAADLKQALETLELKDLSMSRFAPPKANSEYTAEGTTMLVSENPEFMSYLQDFIENFGSLIREIENRQQKVLAESQRLDDKIGAQYGKITLQSQDN